MIYPKHNKLKKSELAFIPQFFDRYIDLVEEDELMNSLKKSMIAIDSINISELELLSDRTYEPGKWTVKDILQHIIDTERIQGYRALRFARNDPKELVGFDEKLYAKNTTVNSRTIKDLIRELKIVREGSILLFENFSNEMLLKTGTAFNVNVSVLSLGFVIIGHQAHHFHIIQERYLPMLKDKK